MSIDRMTRILRSSALLVLLALGLVLLGMAVTATPAHAATVAIENNEQVVEFGKGIYIGPNLDVKSAVAFGGNIRIDGTVQQEVVAFGGNITVSGTVKKNIVAFGGDVHLTPTAVVGTSMGSGDQTVVSIGGSVTKDAGAQVTGHTKTIHRGNWASGLGALGSTDWSGWFGWSLVGWIVQTAICIVLALVAVALLPKQLTAVQRSLGRRPAASLGWGALTFFVIVPVTFVVLIISIVGILLAIPLLVFVLLAYFFVGTGVAAFVVQRLLSSGGRTQPSLMAAVLIGVVATTLISRIPFAGGLVVLVMLVFGVGAGVLAFVEWRRGRRLATAPAGGPTGPAGGYPGGPGGYPAGPAPSGTAPMTGAPAGPMAYAPAAAPVAAAAAPDLTQQGAEPATQVEAAGEEPATQVQTPASEPVTVAAPAAAAPEPPAAPPAPDASLLPAPSSHVPPAPPSGQE